MPEFTIPRDGKYGMHCKTCYGELRAVRLFGIGDWFIVCDDCDTATIAPASMHDFLDELQRSLAQLPLT